MMSLRLKQLFSRRGSQITEAAIVFPILILSAMLMLRVFTFYLEILSVGIHEHMTALDSWDRYNGAGVKKYTSHREVRMLNGGLLKFDLSKTIDTDSFMLNEDNLVKAGEMFN